MQACDIMAPATVSRTDEQDDRIYPAFRKYPNFIGNYGNAWWSQKEEFEAFHGPILMTTNCIVPPKDSYRWSFLSLITPINVSV